MHICRLYPSHGFPLSDIWIGEKKAYLGNNGCAIAIPGNLFFSILLYTAGIGGHDTSALNLLEVSLLNITSNFPAIFNDIKLAIASAL